MTDKRKPTLGWIEPGENIIPDRDVFNIIPWLKVRGFEKMDVVVRTSKADGDHTFENLIRAGDLGVLVPVGKELISEGADAVMWACTSGSFIGGPQWTLNQAASLTKALDRPASSTTLSLLAALRRIGAEKVDVLGPYPREIVNVLIGTIETNGFPVEASAALGSPTGTATFAINMLDEACKFAEATKGSRNPVVIPDTAANTLNLLTQLEEILGRPVITAVAATLWYGMVLLGFEPRISNAGTLFAGDFAARS